MPEKETQSIIKIKDEMGNIKECNVLFLFEPKNSPLKYVVYTDNTTDESGAKRVFAHKYSDNNSNLLFPLETEEEWYTVEAILNKLTEKNKGGNE